MIFLEVNIKSFVHLCPYLHSIIFLLIEQLGKDIFLMLGYVHYNDFSTRWVEWGDLI